uniref:Enoyl reductase (ER) domain-containing protein n=1 Tax=Noctiluca scintillans TaxID=2966 RepID=A0A7S1A7Z7_NOCSC|eukprot:CAMPEP_0194518616 /NCGR_PEP_ID=MMETSP0253-20130528/52090_1 /TAXON_ID=2966 /ORGANISM="Noctiluca scintillans" /LENGTH=380 /DNA_ID=CAMNT_0039362673 /DNA_START=21 /DNA_END=1163 /DNA_ORIENTATION=+
MTSALQAMMGTTFLGVKTTSDTNPLGYVYEARNMPAMLQATDVLVRVHKTTICGTDLHILGGNVPGARPGLGLGHEGIGDIVDVGSAVQKWKVGDRVLCSCISACGTCRKCAAQRFGNCEHEEGGWVLGHTLDGMQSEFARVPFADTSCFRLPEKVEGSEEDRYLMLADILPTAYEIGLVDGQMADGKTLAVVGVGPVGLACILAAKAMYKAAAIVAVDLNESRLEIAKSMGATHTVQVHDGNAHLSAPQAVREELLAKLDELADDGVDVVVEAVGLPSGWDVAQEIVKAGGNIAILGVHGKPVTLNLQNMWYRNFTLTAGMVHGYSIPALMKQVEIGNLPAEKLISHHWDLSQVEEAYDMFSARKDGALKMLLTHRKEL